MAANGGILFLHTNDSSTLDGTTDKLLDFLITKIIATRFVPRVDLRDVF